MAKKTAKKSARKPNAAFMKPMTPSAALSEVVGTKPIPRTEVTKKLWAYIKKNKLQDQKNKRMIKADDATANSCYLRCLFTSRVISNMETCLLPPNTGRRLSSALIMRRFFES